MFHCTEINYFSNDFTSVGSFGTCNFKLIPSQPYAFYDNLSWKKNIFKHRSWFYGELSAKKQISVKIYNKTTKTLPCSEKSHWKGTPKSHFYNFCPTAYSGHAIHKHQLALPVRAVTTAVIAREYFHYCACWASLHTQISKNKQVSQEVSNHCEFSNCFSLQLLLLTALVSYFCLFLSVLKKCQGQQSALSKVCYLKDKKGKKQTSHNMQ